MAGDANSKSGWQQSLETANRLRPVVIALLAVALVGVFPAHHKDTRKGAAAKRADVSTTGGSGSQGPTAATPAGEGPAPATATAPTPPRGTAARASLNPGTTATTAAQ